jgi:hypothetical protein
MKATGSPDVFVNVYETTCVTSQNVIFIVTMVRTSNYRRFFDSYNLFFIVEFL